MKQLIASILVIASLLASPLPARAEEDLPKALENAGVVVAVDPPQASAEALLQLPSVYAMPGTFTYWLKQVVEQIQLILTSDPEDRANLLFAFSRERLAEGYEAIKSGKAEQALASLERYQKEQFDLATSLNSIQDSNADVDIAPYLERLQEQLELQQALQEFVDDKVIDQANRDEISQLLEISSVQRLAWQRYNQSALLGERDVHPVRQSTESATPSATTNP